MSFILFEFNAFSASKVLLYDTTPESKQEAFDSLYRGADRQFITGSPHCGALTIYFDTPVTIKQIIATYWYGPNISQHSNFTKKIKGEFILKEALSGRIIGQWSIDNFARNVGLYRITPNVFLDKGSYVLDSTVEDWKCNEKANLENQIFGATQIDLKVEGPSVDVILEDKKYKYSHREEFD